MEFQLTGGALATIMRGEEYEEPILQVLSIKKMNTGSGQPDKDRYRALLSDGQFTISFALMTAPVYAKVGAKGLPKFSIVKINQYSSTVLSNNNDGKDSRVILIQDIELLKDGDEVVEKIGDPIQYSEAAAASQRQAPPRHSPPRQTPPVATVSSTSVRKSYDNGPPAKVARTENTPYVGSSNGIGNVSMSGRITHPISSLSPYLNKWVIKARVINKSDRRSWNNAKGTGELFSIDLADETGEIRCTAFREMVEKYFDLIEVDKVYYISKCQLKMANSQFNRLKNDYEMTTTSETIIEECTDDEELSKLQTKYDFVEISKLVDMEANNTVDVIGVAISTGELQTFQAKSTGRELKKKEIQLVDQSNTTVTLTLWGAQAENFDGSGNPIVALKGARISEYGGGKSLSTISSTLLRINPDLKDCFRLRGWYESEGKNARPNDISVHTNVTSFETPWMCFKGVLDQQLGASSAKGDYYQVKATVLLMRTENCLYKACPLPECNKKIVDNNNQTYTCEKCQKTYPNYKWRLLCSMNVGDWSGNQWMNLFSDEAEKIIGKTAEEAGTLLEQDPPALHEMMEKAHFKEFIFKCRVKMENWKDENRLKTVAVRVDPINYETYNAHLLDNIKKLQGL